MPRARSPFWPRGPGPIGRPFPESGAGCPRPARNDPSGPTIGPMRRSGCIPSPADDDGPRGPVPTIAGPSMAQAIASTTPSVRRCATSPRTSTGEPPAGRRLTATRRCEPGPDSGATSCISGTPALPASWSHHTGHIADERRGASETGTADTPVSRHRGRRSPRRTTSMPAAKRRARGRTALRRA